MMSSCGFCNRQRTISMRWRSPTDRSATMRVRTQRQAVIGWKRSSIVSASPRRISLGKASAMFSVTRQRVEQREVLEHHADAEAAGGRGVGEW